MNKTLLVVGSLGVALAASLCAQPVNPDPIADILFPVEFVQHYQDDIALSLEQRVWLRTEIEKTQRQVADLQARLLKEKEILAPLLKPDRLDEAAALAQSDKALDLDRDIRREHMALLIRLKNRLTPEQQAKLQQIKKRGIVLQEKLRKAQEMARQKKLAGKDLLMLRSLQDQLEPLVQDGKLAEAEAVLDRTLRLLEGK
jgi:Spy/CpxP family protein refolding chaperone